MQLCSNLVLLTIWGKTIPATYFMSKFEMEMEYTAFLTCNRNALCVFCEVFSGSSMWLVKKIDINTLTTNKNVNRSGYTKGVTLDSK